MTLPSGAVRYEVRVHTSDRGRSVHKRRRFKTRGEAVDFEAQARADARAGRLAPRHRLTVAQAVAEWLAAQEIDDTTRAAYEAALAPVVERHGGQRVDQIVREDVTALMRDLRDGRGPGGRRWRRGSINPMRARWAAVWADLVEQGVLERNAVALAKPLRKKDDTSAGPVELDLSDRLSDTEVEAVLAAHPGVLPAEGVGVRSPEYRAALRAPLVWLALMGLRRGELAGLRWDHLSGGSLLVADTTTIVVRGAVRDQVGGKSGAARRRLVLPAGVGSVLEAARERQGQERERLGERWRGEAGGAGRIITHADGRAVPPGTLDLWWTEALRVAGVEHRRLHAARHTAASRLWAQGAGPAVVAGWLGHADGGVLALRTYGHVSAEEVAGAAELLWGSGNDDAAEV